MKWISLLFIYFLSGSTLAQSPSKVEEKTLHDPYHFKGQKRSLIQWNNIDSKVWLDYEDWKTQALSREKNANWFLEKREKELTELMGKVISCVGTCHIYRGKAAVNASYRSKIYEGDDVLTDDDSYAWIYMMDGTLARISPHSSVSFKEINVAETEVFYHIRINEGWLNWQSRLPFKLKPSNLEETDPLFLPLALKEANSVYYQHLERQNNTEEKLLASVAQDKTHNLAQFEKLNKMIENNNEKMTPKISKLFLVMPNGTIFGQNLQLELYYRLGRKAYFKLKDPNELYQIDPEKDEVKQHAYFFYRGYNNLEMKDISVAQWYEVDEKGRNIKDFDEGEKVFHLSEILTKRTPSIMLAREFWLNQYSLPLLQSELTKAELGKTMGYRLWTKTPGVEDKTEIEERLIFLKEYTRRLETTHLSSIEKVNEKLDEDSKIISKSEAILEPVFYQKAFDAYVYQLSNLYESKQDEALELNRLGYHFWLMLNAKGNH
ncbi:MAG: hypothetical protein ACOYL6_07195 [Bacteriovoracaceae bacterium]